jgi:hypothetical protein
MRAGASREARFDRATSRASLPSMRSANASPATAHGTSVRR